MIDAKQHEKPNGVSNFFIEFFVTFDVHFVSAEFAVLMRYSHLIT